MTAPESPLKPGAQLACTACTTRVVVVKIPAGRQPVIECGGSPMGPVPSGVKPVPPGPDAVTLIGKRYVDADGSVELLCTSSGAGELACDGAPMTIKSPKPLPASD